MSTPYPTRRSSNLPTTTTAAAAAIDGQNHHQTALHPTTSTEHKTHPNKVFTEEDEVRLLKSFSKFSKTHSNSTTQIPIDSPLFDLVNKTLGPKFTPSQITDKIQRLRAKYHKQARSKSYIKTLHDRKLYEISRTIWGKNNGKKDPNPNTNPNEKEGTLDEEEEEEEELNMGVVAEEREEEKKQKGNVELERFPILVEECERCFLHGNGVWREGLKGLGEEKLRVLNDKWVMLRFEEANLMAKKAELAQEVSMMILESVTSSSSLTSIAKNST